MSPTISKSAGEAPEAGKSRKPFDKAAFVLRFTLFSLAALTVLSFISFDYDNIQVFAAIGDAFDNLVSMLSQAKFTNITFKDALFAVLVTIGLAFLTTVFGAVIALFFGLLAARNLSNPTLSYFIRGGVAFIRAVPTVLWVLIFAVPAGLGSVAAVIGMTFHSIGYLIKAYSESFEELDKGMIEALRSSGASWWHIVFQAVIPSSRSYIMSWTFMRFEINCGAAVAMGAAAGAGGVGFDMFMASSFYLDMNEVGAITWLILLFAIALETSATRMKNKLK
ncbi:ABC transporter permease subunit [Paenibacillus sp. J5C_2022]|uniref:PhnE/PtxC family ABC transporter permease n=1 Tax=Paenibacillus sp. J5C2022 TaxID=2977129 RepID=UPI0021CE971A|nr:ABC transporter permease subunit [Paenibacillus sp. J5C2022]MCU6710180.1 ABC transporter permease subunit [Paenibacillus sp. J5C2022]